MGPIKRRKVEAALARKGFVRDERDHAYFIYYRSSGLRTSVHTKTSHGRGSADISPSLLSMIRRQLHLEGNELRRLIDCPLDQDGFESLMVERGILQPPA